MTAVTEVVGVPETGEDVVEGVVPRHEVRVRTLGDVEAVELDGAVDENRHGRGHDDPEQSRQGVQGEALGQA
jgi:hypothetical protein